MKLKKCKILSFAQIIPILQKKGFPSSNVKYKRRFDF